LRGLKADIDTEVGYFERKEETVQCLEMLGLESVSKMIRKDMVSQFAHMES